MDRGSAASQHWVARVNIGRVKLEYWPDKRVCIIRNDGNWIKGVMHMRCVIDANNYTYMFKRLSSGNVKLLASYLSQSSVEGSQMLLRQMFSCHSGFLWQVIRALEWLTNNIFPPGCDSIVVPHVCHQVFPWVSLCNRISAARPGWRQSSSLYIAQQFDQLGQLSL